MIKFLIALTFGLLMMYQIFPYIPKTTETQRLMIFSVAIVPVATLVGIFSTYGLFTLIEWFS